MAVSLTARIFLIVLLPVIAVLLYREGQHFEPALISFQQSSSAGEIGRISFPGEVAGYRLVSPVRSFGKDNLYEYVNGHAEYFLSAGFTSLSVGEYAKGAGDDAAPDMVVDIYDMGKGIQALGVLSDESGGQYSEMQGGILGFSTPQGMSIVKGRYYVRMAAYDQGVPADRFAEAIGAVLEGGADPFSEFSRLPDIGEVVSTRYIKEAYRGLDFVFNIIEREYRTADGTVQIFAYSGQDRAGLIQSFREYFRESGVSANESGAGDWRIFRVADPYEGDWVLISVPDAVFGVFGDFDESVIRLLCACSPEP
jgi:hypothetical protein